MGQCFYTNTTIYHLKHASHGIFPVSCMKTTSHNLISLNIYTLKSRNLYIYLLKLLKCQGNLEKNGYQI